MATPISQKIIEEIKNKKVSPKPRWQFKLERIAISCLLIIFLAIGIIAASLILEIASQLHPDRIILRPRGWHLLLAGFPYLWLILAVAGVTLAAADFLRTRHGYRYRLSSVALVTLVVIFLGGFLLYSFELSDGMERYLEKQFIFYGYLTETPRQFWLQPKEGLLSGTVVRDDEDVCPCFRLEDWNKEDWEVDYSRVAPPPPMPFAEGDEIKVIGAKGEDHNFQAEEIGPWTKKPEVKK